MTLFKKGTSLDQLVSSAVFVIGICCTSEGALSSKMADVDYVSKVQAELNYLYERVQKSGLSKTVRVLLVYTPLASKAELVEAFDSRLKGLQ
ncbi:MAG: hypothetical protein EON58_15500 [Alphaproteobacteria bacterium]|nr:MAG: hypothetical protein EON58_15500 [Alphaproteobacteria bacterium]